MWNEILRAGSVLLSTVSREYLNNSIKRETKKSVDRVRPWILRTDSYSVRLLKELENDDPLSYNNYLRLTTNEFEKLLRVLEGLISKLDTAMRQAIPTRTELGIRFFGYWR
jgi:hypothetical protein